MKNKTVKLVMLVDDNPTDNFINERMIQLTHFAEQIRVENSANSALKYLQINQNDLGKLPNVLFLDINMPIMNAQEFLLEFERLPQNIQDYIKVFILSSSDSKLDKEKYLAHMGVKNFYTKPLTTSVLEEVKTIV